MQWLAEYYLVLKALHIIAVVAWFAGMFYLPRLYVYHAGVAPGSEASELFKVMERRLLRAIINPAMALVFVFGILLALVPGVDAFSQGWFHVKLTLVLILSAYHGYLARVRRAFAADRNTRDPRFYRMINEVPTVILIAVVFLAVLKPF